MYINGRTYSFVVMVFLICLSSRLISWGFLCRMFVSFKNGKCTLDKNKKNLTVNLFLYNGFPFSSKPALPDALPITVVKSLPFQSQNINYYLENYIDAWIKIKNKSIPPMDGSLYFVKINILLLSCNFKKYNNFFFQNYSTAPTRHMSTPSFSEFAKLKIQNWFKATIKIVRVKLHNCVRAPFWTNINYPINIV